MSKLKIISVILEDTIQHENRDVYKLVLEHLDKILDYLTVDELTHIALVSKFFCYVATMDKLYVKFGIVPSESFVEESLWSYKLSEIYSTLKAYNLSESNSLLKGIHKRLMSKNSIKTVNK